MNQLVSLLRLHMFPKEGSDGRVKAAVRRAAKSVAKCLELNKGDKEGEYNSYGDIKSQLVFKLFKEKTQSGTLTL